MIFEVVSDVHVRGFLGSWIVDAHTHGWHLSQLVCISMGFDAVKGEALDV